MISSCMMMILTEELLFDKRHNEKDIIREVSLILSFFGVIFQKKLVVCECSRWYEYSWKPRNWTSIFPWHSEWACLFGLFRKSLTITLDKCFTFTHSLKNVVFTRLTCRYLTWLLNLAGQNYSWFKFDRKQLHSLIYDSI